MTAPTGKFYYSWPSWLTELISGIIAVILIWIAGPESFWRFALSVHLVSVVYELFIDPNGWSIDDVVQREAGIATGLFLWLALH